jgi:antitoxin ParD1/3/4
VYASVVASSPFGSSVTCAWPLPKPTRERLMLTPLSDGRLWYLVERAVFLREVLQLQIAQRMNISLPDSLREYIDEQVGSGGYGTSSEYVRELIRKDQDRKRLRAMILDGVTSGLAGRADADYFESLRAHVRTTRK